METKQSRKISRRGFLKASAITVASATGTNALASSASNMPVDRSTAVKALNVASPSVRVGGYCGEGDWLGAPPVVHDADIARTIEVDVVVVGGGHAGLLAALGASDKGAKVAVIEKQTEKAFDGYYGRVGEDIGHVNSKWLISRGYGPYDTGEITAEFVKRAAGRCNPDIIRLYVENSGAMFDRMVEVYEGYKDLRKANDSKVEFKYSGGMSFGGGGMPSGAGSGGGMPGGASSAGGMPGGAGGAPGGAGGAGGGMPGGGSGAGGMPGGAGGDSGMQGGAGGAGGGMPGSDSGTTVIYDFSNIISKEHLINQVQKGVKPKDYPIILGGYKTWPCNAQFMGPILRKSVGGMVSVLRWFEKYHVQKTKDQGTDWYYETTVVVLAQEPNGDVTGVIAKDSAGKYIKFKARKGVILATGDFIGNPDMCWALLNECQEWAERAGTTKEQFTSAGQRNGDGHKMACWAGGMIEPSPRGYMGIGGGAAGPWGEGPMLQLNGNAKRFCNEAAAPLVAQAVRRQASGIMCVVTDKKFMKSVETAGLEHGGPNYGRPEYYQDMEEDMGKVLGTGAKGAQVRGCAVAERMALTVYGANTLEELAGYLGYKGDLVKTFVESIKHYNKLCYAGVDSDYGKDAKAMIPIDEPPFYACTSMGMGRGARPTMVTVSGIMADNKLRPLNKEGQPIKGIFVCGNTLGGRYGLGYSTPFAGNNIGMAMTHGWLAGKFAADI
jgi:hypothetical protein